MPQKDLRHCNYYRKRTTSRVGKQGSCFAPVKEGDTNNRFGLPGWAKIPDLRASGSRRRPEGFVRESDPQLQCATATRLAVSATLRHLQCDPDTAQPFLECLHFLRVDHERRRPEPFLDERTCAWPLFEAIGN